jgi:hypothetical protein
MVLVDSGGGPVVDALSGGVRREPKNTNDFAVFTE